MLIKLDNENIGGHLIPLHSLKQWYTIVLLCFILSEH